eukprot:scaffold3666_cov21-Tisochrysis_lutea.AAC.6
MATMGERLLYKPIPSQHHGFSASQQKPANTSVVHKDTGTDVTSSRSPEGPRVFHNRSTIDHGQSSMTDQITDMDGLLRQCQGILPAFTTRASSFLLGSFLVFQKP